MWAIVAVGDSFEEFGDQNVELGGRLQVDWLIHVIGRGMVALCRATFLTICASGEPLV